MTKTGFQERTNSEKLVFAFVLQRNTKFGDHGCHLKFCSASHLNSMGANNPPMGFAFDRRGNQEGRERGT